MEATSTFWYLKNLPLYETTKPYILHVPISHIPAGKRTNQECEACPGIKVRDIRTAIGRPFTLDRNGFELSRSIPMSLEYEGFSDRAKVKGIYCENVKQALVSMTGAEAGHVLHVSSLSKIRRRHPSFPAQPRGSEDAPTDQPVQGVHCDFTPRRAYQTVREVYGKEEGDRIWNERRIAAIQVWRPLTQRPVVDWPLGVCDVTSVDETRDLVPTDNVWTYTTAETYNVLYNPKHAWYFVNNQTCEDTLLFKGFDNKRGVASFCAHAAFEVGHVSEVLEMRESVECAVLLIYPKQI